MLTHLIIIFLSKENLERNVVKLGEVKGIFFIDPTHSQDDCWGTTDYLATFQF